jgi:hypothetical protein
MLNSVWAGVPMALIGFIGRHTRRFESKRPCSRKTWKLSLWGGSSRSSLSFVQPIRTGHIILDIVAF